MDLKLWLWIFLAAISTAIYVILIKYYIKNNSFLILLSIALILILSTYSYYVVFMSKNISSAYPIIKALAMITVVLAGIILFQEHLGVKGVFGIFLIIIGILLLI